jgi:hypothetical protein
VTITVSFILLIVAIILFFIAAILGFKWFGTTNPEDAIGWVALGLIAFAAAHLPLGPATRT